MVYKPNKKEIKQIKKLNEGYVLLRKGLGLVLNNVPRNDGEISVYTYKIGKNMAALIRRVTVLLEVQYMDRQFTEIVDNMKIKKKKR